MWLPMKPATPVTSAVMPFLEVGWGSFRPSGDATFSNGPTDEIPMTELNLSVRVESQLDPCPLCGGVRGRLVFRLPFDRVWGRDPIDRAGSILSLYECTTCELDWFSPLELGGGEFYAELDRGGYYEPTRWEFDVVAPRVTERDRVLDLGCGDGAFVKQVRAVAAGVAGYDFNPDAIRDLLGDGVAAYHGAIDDVGESLREQFDLVTAFHVIEHLPDVRAFVRAGTRALRRGGTFVISVPNRDRLRLADVEPLDFPPSRWSEKQLARLGDETGLTLTDIEYEPTRWRTQLHVLAHRASARVRRAKPVPGAPTLRDQYRNRRRGLAMLATYRRP
jgi:SAM-dependent methyltransferase